MAKNIKNIERFEKNEFRKENKRLKNSKMKRDIKKGFEK